MKQYHITSFIHYVIHICTRLLQCLLVNHLVLIPLLFAFPVQAADTPDMAIRIKADYAEFNSQENKATYLGRVQISRHDILIEADSAVFMNTPAINNQPGKQTAQIAGSPVTFRFKDKKGEITSGSSKFLTYNQSTSLVEFKEQAFLQQNNREFHGDYIIYNLNSKDLIAKSNRSATESEQMDTTKQDEIKSETKDQRVNIVIYPETTDTQNKKSKKN